MIINNFLRKEGIDETKPLIINKTILNSLRPNEYFIYHYLLTSYKDFVPSYEIVGELLNIRSKTTISKVLNRLKQLKLLTIQPFENVFIWTVRYTEEIIEGDEPRIKIVTKLSRDELVRQIGILEESLDFIAPEMIESTIEEIVNLKAKLNGGK